MNEKEAIKDLVWEKLEITPRYSARCNEYLLIKYVIKNKMRRPGLVPLTESEITKLAKQVIKDLRAGGKLRKTI